MNTLTQIGKQITDLLASMTPAARIMAGLMVGVIVLSFGWIINAQNTSKYETLLGGVTLSNEELDRIETAFGDAQLRDYVREGRQIRIPFNQKDLYLKALSSGNAIPKTWGSEYDRAFSEGNIFESIEKFSARIETSRERELAGILKRMTGIEFVAVEYDEKRQGFGREVDRTCSIYVQGPHSDPVSQAVMRSIAETAQTHFAGIPASNISVLDLGTATHYRKSDDPHAAKENPVLAAQQEWEKYYYDKVSAVLKEYGAVELMVNVELDPTLTEETEKLQYDPTAVTLQSMETRKDFENAKAPPAGPPGADINGIGNKAQSLSAAPPSQTSRTKESEANERRVAGHDATRKRTAGLNPTKVSVSIGIPDTYYRDVFNHRYLLKNPDAATTGKLPTPTAVELADLQAEVKTSIQAAVEGIAVGIRDGDDRKPFVNVYAFTRLPLPAIPEPSLAKNAMGWLAESWTTLALLAVVLLSLGMMFSWVKSQGTAAATAAADSDRRFADGFGLEVPDSMGDELELSEAGAGEGQEPGKGRTRPKPEFDTSGEEMKEDLSTLIRENPDAVVNLLKTWIGDAA